MRWHCSETLRSQTKMLHNSQRLTITLCFILVASWFHCLLHFYAFAFSLENHFMVTTKFSFWKIFLSYKAGTRLARSAQGFDFQGNLAKSVKIILVSYLTLKWKDKNKKLWPTVKSTLGPSPYILNVIQFCFYVLSFISY